MAVSFTSPRVQLFDDDGDPLAGGKIYTYEADTTTPKATYTDSTENTANPNPVVLDSAGRATIFVTGTTYCVPTDSNDVAVGDPFTFQAYAATTGDNTVGSIIGLTEASPASGDFIPFADISDSNNVRRATLTASVAAALLDEDDFASDSDTRGATQQSIKAYVDNNSGGWTTIETKTLSSDATADFTNDVSSYDVVEFELIDIVPATNDSVFWLRTSTDGGSTYDSGAGNYDWSIEGQEAASNNLDDGSAADTKMVLTAGSTLTDGVGNDTGEALNGVIRVYKPSSTNSTQIGYHITYITATGSIAEISGSASRIAAADVDAFRFLFDSGNIASGKIVQRGRVSS